MIFYFTWSKDNPSVTEKGTCSSRLDSMFLFSDLALLSDFEVSFLLLDFEALVIIDDDVPSLLDAGVPVLPTV